MKKAKFLITILLVTIICSSICYAASESNIVLSTKKLDNTIVINGTADNLMNMPQTIEVAPEEEGGQTSLAYLDNNLVRESVKVTIDNRLQVVDNGVSAVFVDGEGKTYQLGADNWTIADNVVMFNVEYSKQYTSKSSLQFSITTTKPVVKDTDKAPRFNVDANFSIHERINDTWTAIDSSSNQTVITYDESEILRTVFDLYLDLKNGVLNGETGTIKYRSKLSPGTNVLISEVQKPTREGFQFDGWVVNVDQKLGDDETIIFQNDDIIMKATWIDLSDKLKIDPNDGAGSPFYVTGYLGDQVSVPDADDFSFSNHKFVYWNTERDGSGKTYKPESKYKLTSEDDILYAIWSPICKLQYDANGGKGSIVNRLYAADEEFEVAKNEFTYSGMVFTGWNTKPDGSGSAYKEGERIHLDEDTVLYAQWEPMTIAAENNNSRVPNAVVFLIIGALIVGFIILCLGISRIISPKDDPDDWEDEETRYFDDEEDKEEDLQKTIAFNVREGADEYKYGKHNRNTKR